jgi:hypothetical protein
VLDIICRVMIVGAGNSAVIRCATRPSDIVACWHSSDDAEEIELLNVNKVNASRRNASDIICLEKMSEVRPSNENVVWRTCVDVYSFTWSSIPTERHSRLYQA